VEIPILRHLQTRSAVIAVNVIAALALVFAAASVALDVNEVSVERDLAGAPVDAATDQPHQSDFKVNEIVSAHLMGNPARARPVRVERAPTTKLNLTLKGLLSTHDQEMARAIIAIGKKKDRLYAVGDKLKEGNATVKEIQDDLVLLDRNGKIESLPLPKKLTSANVSRDALYIPEVAQPKASEQEINPMADVPAAETTNIPPARRAPAASSVSGVQDVIERMGGGQAVRLPPETAPEQ
jgi:type II secretory pathway component PulC